MGTLSVVQRGSSGAARASGTSASVLFSNTTGPLPVPNYLLVCTNIFTGQTISGITSPACTGSLAQLGSLPNGGSGDLEIWGAPITGASRNITVTTSGGETWDAFAAEVSGGVGLAGFPVSATGTSASPSLTVSTNVTPGSMIFAMVNVTNTISAGPSSPWVNFNSGSFNWSPNGDDVTYEIVPSGSNSGTAAYTQSSSGAWGMLGVVLTPTSSGLFGLL